MGVSWLPSKQDQLNAISKLKDKAQILGFDAKITRKLPRLMIQVITTSQIEFIELIKQQNPETVELSKELDFLRLVTIHDTKFGLIKKAIIEVSRRIWKFIMKSQRIKLGLCLQSVFDYVHVLRCCKCNRYGHSGRLCRSENQICGICAREPTSVECNAEPHLRKRSNCPASDRGSTEFKKCPAYHGRKLYLKSIIEYE